MSARTAYSYERSLKADAGDELMNVYILRPLAGRLVRILYNTRVTPNHLSLAALAAGVLAAVLYSLNNPASTVYAGLSITLKDLLDSADGQLARAKQQYSRAGRFLDSIGDFVVNLLVFTAFTWALTTSTHNKYIPILGLLGFLGISLRVSYHVFYHVAFLHTQKQYMQNRLSEEIKGNDQAADRFTLQLQSLFLALYGWQDRVIMWIDGWCRKGMSRFPEVDERWHGDSIGLLLSGFIGMGTELFLLMVCSVANALEVYLWLNLLLMNAVWAACVLYRRYALRARILRGLR